MGPVIGITAQVRDVETSGGLQPAHTVTRSYSDAVLAAGGVPLLLPTLPPDAAPEIAGRLDGLLLTGGGDVAPEFYDGDRHPSMYGIDIDRDLFEIALVKQVAHLRLPTLAICRGMQLLNVALGGSLLADLPSAIDGALDHFVPGEPARTPHQRVSLTEDSRLAGLLGTTELVVNSIHHQAVLRPAPTLVPVGWSDDGVVEAVEPNENGWPLLAVQWHPEHLVHGEEAARKIFNALVAAAGDVRAAAGRG